MFDAAFSSLVKEGQSLLLEHLETPMKAWVVAHAFLQSGRDVLILTG